LFHRGLVVKGATRLRQCGRVGLTNSPQPQDTRPYISNGGKGERVIRHPAYVVPVVLVLAALGVAAPAAAATDRLPDLQMGGVDEFSIDTKTIPGHRLLRYTAIIINMGTGPFEVHGQRPDTSTPTMSVTQRIYDTDGGYRDVVTPATMYYAGDGHNHWHVTDLESARLTRDNGTVVGTQAKHGFCFADNVFWVALPGSPSSPAYTDCGGDPNLLQVTTGLSIGYADVYGLNTNLQWIDITGLPSGTYRLTDIADDANQFVESDESNNFTWTDIRIRRNKVQIVATGP
jgi:hypothetical protein